MMPELFPAAPLVSHTCVHATKNVFFYHVCVSSSVVTHPERLRGRRNGAQGETKGTPTGGEAGGGRGGICTR